MSVLKIISSSAEELFVIIIATEDELISVVKKEKLSKSLNLLNNKLYKLLYLDLDHNHIYSVSFMPKDLPSSTFALPLYQCTQNDSFKTPDQAHPSRSLTVEHQSYMINLCDSKASLTSRYSIDEEPLIEIKSQSGHSDSKSQVQSQSILSEALNVKIENYQIIIEHERKMREAVEEKNREVLGAYDRCMKNAREKEERFRGETIRRDEEINGLRKEVYELKLVCEKYAVEADILKENCEFRILSAKNSNYDEQLECYKTQLEVSDQKWKKLIDQLEESDEHYPLHYLLKEKEQENAELNKRIKELSENSFEFEINKFLSDLNIKYYKENDLVYRVSGQKLIISRINHEFIVHSLGKSLTVDEVSSKRAHNRSISDMKAETPKSTINKGFASTTKKFLAPPFLSKKSP